jgi:2-isopropylmalate synthase
MTKRAGRSASNDPCFQALLQANAAAVCLLAKSWDYHVELALGISGDENLDAIGASVEAVRAAGREALIDFEQFFDGYRANPALLDSIIYKLWYDRASPAHGA